MGILFFLALIGGAWLIAFLLVGLGGGWALMYPTIAVEGSDSFDAISRSFSYVFARPWRAGLYGAGGPGLRGDLLPVRAALRVPGPGVHALLRGPGALRDGPGEQLARAGRRGQQDGPALDRADLRQPVHADELAHRQRHRDGLGVHPARVGLAGGGGGVRLRAELLRASSSTVIYYLLRQKVDATDLDDVFVEEIEEPPAEPAAQPSAPPAAGAEAPPASPPGDPAPPPAT